uniref:Mitochondrial assembly of ribosomal large subunit protein 1 n=1 Tax=Lepisosteus oculatus TaxID=7918 RepID=W5N0T0_LEPOC|nr:PREDICTED: mitochondrial assembly of ribosomal large subunit protein 1 [Lepisosteus oculatus]
MNRVALSTWTKRLLPILSQTSIHTQAGRGLQTGLNAVAAVEQVWSGFYRGAEGGFPLKTCADLPRRLSHTGGTELSHVEDRAGFEVKKRTGLCPDFSIDFLVALLRQENAGDICVIRVPEEMKYTDYFVVVSGSSTRHLRAMALYAIKVYKHVKRNDDPHIQIEGKDADDWMCIDFGHIVVHFMLPETRELYELEKLWTLRSYDEQLGAIPPETLPEDFTYGAAFSNEPLQ